MKKIFACGLLLTALSGFAQKENPDVYAKSITPADLKKHLYVLASEEMEGRETATEGQRKAAAYIENYFRQLGLQPANNNTYLQNFNVYQDSLTDAAIEINGQSFILDKDFNVNINTAVPSTLRFSEVVLIGQNAFDSLNTMDLSGKLVLLLNETPVVATRSNPNAAANYNLLRSKGVAAILMVSKNYPRNSPSSRKAAQTLNAFKKFVAPQQFVISENLAKAVIKNYDSVIRNTTSAKIYSAEILLNVQKKTTVAQSSNVVGILEGSDLKGEYLFITAHYDHLGKRDTVIYYGADDDGSGTVGVLELAEAFSKAKAAGKGPRRSIVFMTVSGEEKGLWGSEYYAAHPLYALEKTTADLNIDMIGRIDPKRTKGDSTNYVYVVGDDKLSSDLRIISEAMNNKYTKLELDYKYNDPNDQEFIYYRSDHYNFAKHGVPIIFYFNGTHADYHRPTDTPDKINYELMSKRARLIFYTAWEMANRNGLLKRDLPLPVLRR